MKMLLKTYRVDFRVRALDGSAGSAAGLLVYFPAHP
jgi:hypothetical protein